jgi:hypothetical protein
MKIKPGCGCLIILLAMLNLVLVVSAIFSIFKGASETPVQPSKLLLAGSALIFAANVAVCVMLGLASLRGVSFGRRSAEQDEDGSTPEESTPLADEGTDEVED